MCVSAADAGALAEPVEAFVRLGPKGEPGAVHQDRDHSLARGLASEAGTGLGGDGESEVGQHVAHI
jgi:hypothetical protein